MAATKGRIVREYAVTVEHKESRVLVSWDGQVQYSTVQDGWTSEAGAIREAATFLLDTLGCWVEIQSQPLHHNGTKWTKSAGHYVMRLRVQKD